MLNYAYCQMAEKSVFNLIAFAVKKKDIYSTHTLTFVYLIRWNKMLEKSISLHNSDNYTDSYIIKGVPL